MDTPEILSSEQDSKINLDVKLPIGKKRRSLQRFSSPWQIDEEFRSWVKRSSLGPEYFFCRICNVHRTLRGGRCDLQRHGAGKKHLRRKQKLEREGIFPQQSDENNFARSSSIESTPIVSNLNLYTNACLLKLVTHNFYYYLLFFAPACVFHIYVYIFFRI